MRQLLAYIDARFGEGSTYSGLGALLLAAHFSIPPGTWAEVTLWGTVLSGLLAIVIREAGTKPPTEIATDVLDGLIAAIKALPPSAKDAAKMLLIAGLPLLVLSACAGQAVTGPTVQSSAVQLATDVQLIDSGLSAVLPSIVAVAGVPPATVTKLQADLALIRQDTAQVQAAVAASQAAPASAVKEIASVVADIATVVLPAVPGGAAFVPVVQAANALVPVLLNAVGSPVAGAAPAMTAAQARLVLAGAAAR